MDFPLSFISNETLILHDIRLADKNGFFQLDILLLTQKCILILEVKNWYGTIIFDENNQVIRITDDKREEGFPSPIHQAKLQKHRLGKWLHQHGLSVVPIKFFVCISFPSTILKTMSHSISIPKEVLHSNQLVFKNKEMMDSLTKVHISNKDLQILSQRLMESHTPPPIANLLDKYNIASSELIKGVFCTKCVTPSMLKKRYKWVCERCNYESDDSHLENINDYKWIISDTASNKELRNFLKIDCKHVMKRIINKSGFEAIESGKLRKYKL